MTKRNKCKLNPLLYAGHLTMQYILDQGLKLDNSRLSYHLREDQQKQYRRARLYNMKDALKNNFEKLESNKYMYDSC